MKRETFNTSLNKDLLKALRHLAVDQGRAINLLLEEAVSDLLKKHGAEKYIPAGIGQAKLFGRGS